MEMEGLSRRENLFKKINSTLGKDFKDDFEEGKIKTEKEFQGPFFDNPVKEGAGADKLYISVKESFNEKEKKWNLEMNPYNPTVVWKEKVKETLNLQRSEITEMMRERKEGEMLVSGGSWIWINGKLILYERDKLAKTDAGCLTGPRGRCGERLSETVRKEANEEFMIFIRNKGDNSVSLLAFYRGNDEIKEIEKQKLKQVDELIEFWKEKVNEKPEKANKVIKNLEEIKKTKNLMMVDMNQKRVNTPDAVKVEMTMNGKVVDETEGLMFPDYNHNTLEFSEELEVNLSDYEIEEVVYGEPYDQKIVLIEKNELLKAKNEKMVPVLDDYMRKLEWRSVK